MSTSSRQGEPRRRGAVVRPSCFRVLVAGAIAGLCAAVSGAATIQVPADHPTIQAAINAAAHGDTIIVQPGVYLESIDFLGKAITVRSQNPNIPGDTVIDAAGLGRVVRMAGASNAAVLEGFLLRNGHDGTGGGVRIEGPGTIRRCHIRDCTADTFGGGIWAGGGAIIDECEFRENSANNGGGLRISGSATVRNTKFLDNSAANAGGAIHVDGNATIDGVFALGDSAPVARGAWLTGGPITVTRSQFSAGFGAEEGSVVEADTTLTMTNSIVGFGDRSMVLRPGASTATIQIVNCTLAGAETASLTVEAPSLALTILVRNSVLDTDGVGLDGPAYPGLSVQYSHVSGGWPGIGNIDEELVIDPALYAGFQLRPGSAACDGGRNFFAEPWGATDYYGKPRIVDHPLSDDTGLGSPSIVDMGATERQGQRIFVKDTASGSNDGSSWTNAFSDLQDGLAAASTVFATGADAVIMVAEGNYQPDGGTGDRNASFGINHRLWLVGGFSGVDEDEASERDVAAHRTTLGGAIGAAGTADNSFHVLRVDGFANSIKAEVIGVTIQRGNANGSAANLNDRGGGVLIDDGFVTLVECEIRDCESSQTGAAIAIESGSLLLQRSRVYGNATGGTGSAIAVRTGSALLDSCLIHGNTAVGRAALFASDGGDLFIDLTTIGDNASSGGNTGGIFIDTGSLLFLNDSILWKNLAASGTLENQNLRVLGTATVEECTVQGWSGALGGFNNNGSNPKFLLPAGKDRIIGTQDDDYRLAPDSPALDASSAELSPSTPSVDLDGRDRVIDLPAVPNTGVGPDPIYADRGCYEMPAPPCDGDLNGDTVVDAADLAILLGAWGTGAGPADLDSNGTVNGADLAVLLGAWGPC